MNNSGAEGTINDLSEISEISLNFSSMESSIDLLEPTFPEDMNVSPCLNNPILIDVCTQTDAILTDICMQTDAVVDVPSNCLTNNSDDKNLNSNALRRKCFMDGVIENNVTCLFWTGVPNLNLLNYIFEWVHGLLK